MIKRFLKDERGATAIEYGLICAIIFLFVVTAIGNVADNTDAMYELIGDTVSDATN